MNISDNNLQNIIDGSSSTGLIESNSFIGFILFGNHDTYRNNNSTAKINTYPADFLTFFSSNYPTVFNEAFTYYNIAKAYTAELAGQNNIRQYYIITIWDGKGENAGSGGYDYYEDNLISAFGNLSSSQVVGIGSLKKELGGTRRYKIDFTKVDIQGIQLPARTPGQPGTDNKFEIKINSYAGGKKDKEKEVKTENIKLSWTCSGCPSGINYKISIRGYDGIAYKENKETSANSYSTTLENGKYRINVTASGQAEDVSIKSDNTYIQVNTGGGSGVLIFLLILAALAGGGYYWWKKQRDTKARELSGEDQEVPFNI